MLAVKHIAIALVFALFGISIRWVLLPSIVEGQDGEVPDASRMLSGPAFVPDELIISFNPGVLGQDIPGIYAHPRIDERKDLDSTRQDGRPKEKLVTVPGRVTEELIERLNRDPRIKYAERNYIFYADVHPPNDSSYNQLWGLNNTGQTGGTSDADIDAPEAWHSFTTGSSNVIIGVIDTGIDYNHPDLVANLSSNPGETPSDGIDNDGNGYIDDVHGINAITGSGDPIDDNGHGSHVAGTIGGVGNNNVGVVGVNWTVRIAACKFLNSSGNGTTADAVECVKYVNKMKNVYGQNFVITNDSWGGGGSSQSLEDALAGLEQPGMETILHIAAAGNGGGDGIGDDNDIIPHYPSSYALDNIVAVAATDHNDQYPVFTNFGANSVDLSAPGVSILSTVPTGSCTLCSGTGYLSINGTSMATPHVAGAAGLLWANYPTLTAIQAKSRLLFNADSPSDLSKQTVTNSRLNAFNSLEWDCWDLD